jgi:hypothetical protein
MAIMNCRGRFLQDFGLRAALQPSGRVMISTSVFQDQSGAEESNKRAADYVRQNLAPLLPKPPQITAGKVVAYKAK